MCSLYIYICIAMYMCSLVTVLYVYEESFVISYSSNLTFYIYTIEMLLLSLLIETGQRPGTGLTQEEKTCMQLNFYLEILKGGT